VVSNWMMSRLANACQGEDGAEGFHTHYGRKSFHGIDAKTLVVVSSNDSTLILLKNAIRELLIKYPTEFEGLRAVHVRH